MTFIRHLLLLPGLSLLCALPLAAQQSTNVDSLSRCAADCFRQNDLQRACTLYEEVLRLDPSHLQANIFLGSYYFLEAERSRSALEADYRHLSSPTRMQSADFRNRMSTLLQTRYAAAKRYLQRAQSHLPSTEVAHTLSVIAALEQKYL